MIAFQADGSYPSRKEKYNGNRTGCLPIRFSLKKKRKVDRLKKILNQIGCEYTYSKYDNGYSSFWIKLNKKISKTFDWVDISKISKGWCVDFINEIAKWDGRVAGTSNTTIYSSTVKYNIDVVQSVGVLAGYRSSIGDMYIDRRTDCKRQPIHSINICKTYGCRSGINIVKKTIKYNGRIYCVTVPSGMIIVRRNGCVSVSGNSEHSTITSWGKDFEVEAYRNLLEQHPSGTIACVSDSYDIIHACKELWGTQLKNIVLARDGVLVVRPDSGVPEEVVPMVI